MRGARDPIARETAGGDPAGRLLPREDPLAVHVSAGVKVAQELPRDPRGDPEERLRLRRHDDSLRREKRQEEPIAIGQRRGPGPLRGLCRRHTP